MTISLVGGASTNSRANRPLPPGVVSARTLSGRGVRELTEFTRADGSKYSAELLTWVVGQWGGLWGHPTPGNLPKEILRATQEYEFAAQGSYGHVAEHALTDALGHALDGVFSSDAVSCRFGLNGRDALDAAARVARALTGRDFIATEGAYHGAGESFVHPPYPHGVPFDYQKLATYFKWGDVETMRECAKTAAAIVIDAPALGDDEIRPFLKQIRRACDDYGTVFILDEVVTGFRLGLKGAAGYYGVKPDICTYGKAMSATGGVSAITGRRDMVDYLDGRTFHSLTFGGEPSRAAIAAATIEWLTANSEDVYGNARVTGRLRDIGAALQHGLNVIFAEAGVPCIVKGQPERSVMIWDTDQHWLEFCSQMIERGVMVHRPQFPTLVNTVSDVDRTLDAARECLR